LTSHRYSKARHSPRVTVLMSVYGGREYLPQAVESILDQTYRDFEFLVIDDGSPEPVDDIITAYRDERIIFVKQENRGLTRSLNRGLRTARGLYVARMDADDVILPRRLALQVEAMDANADLSMVGSFFDVVDGSGNLIERKELLIDPIYRLWRLQFHNNYGHGSMMLRREAVIATGLYDETLRCAQDFDLWSRLSGKANTRVIPEFLYRYRMVEASSQTSVKNYDAQLAAAIGISNRSLMACNPELSEEDCAHVRALYWRFQREGISRRGMQALPTTLAGFCRRYVLTSAEEADLTKRVLEDASAELDADGSLTPEEKRDIEEVLREHGSATVRMPRP
jgi:glycosyltransferase involved in cell wall biosynthesis